MLRFLSKKSLYPLITFFATLFVTAIIVNFAYSSQKEYSQSLFRNLAEKQTEYLQQVIESDLDLIGSGANFFHSTRTVDWDRFEVFAKELVASSDTLIALQWMEKVEPQDIMHHTEKVQQVFPNFHIYTVTESGEKKLGYTLANQEPIFVATDIYPFSPVNTPLLGFYSSRDRFKNIISGVKSTGQPHVSDKLRLLQDGTSKDIKKSGLLVYHPVFSLQKTNELIGIVIGVIRTTNYFEQLVQRTASEQQLLIKVTDMGFDAEDDPILYQSELWDSASGLEMTKIIELSNREWLVDYKLVNEVSSNDELVLRSLILGGGVIAGLLSYIMLLWVREKERLDEMLEERTEELRFLVEHDALTGLNNRRAFNHALFQLVYQEEQFALVGFDIDRFKFINDTYGHIAGDEMLCLVAEVVKKRLANGDRLFRLGGDEFCILSTITDSNELFSYLNDICRSVAIASIDFEEHTIRCTLSIGAAVRTLEDEEEIMQLADKQLYKSKQRGRNQVSIA